MLRALPSAHGCTVARAVPSTFKASRPRRSGRERPLLQLRCRRGCCCCTGVCSLCLYLRMCRLVSIDGELITDRTFASGHKNSPNAINPACTSPSLQATLQETTAPHLSLLQPLQSC
jgi:hypothetical protein